MQLQPRDLYDKLEFNKILDLLEGECYGELGKEKIRTLGPLTDPRRIQRLLDETAEFLAILNDKVTFPLGTYEDVAEELKMLEIEGFVLPEEGLRSINVLLLFTRGIFQFFKGGRSAQYPTLYDQIRNVEFNAELIQEIERVIDEDGNIKPDASPELSRIRRHIGSKQRELDKAFQSIINEYRKKGWLTDNVESFRNGRRVLSVPAEHKRKIRGIIHDESSTGKTAFIEPERVIDINNDIFDLQQEEKREVYRILRELSATLRPYVQYLRLYRDIIVIFDVIQAKARLARRLDADRPKLKPESHLGIRQGRHPLLYLKNRKIGRPTVPFDLTLFGANRVLVLSGPNAGGKSVTMKAVGLLQLMLQSGMLVPADPESEFGIFESFFADIGDQQSLEDDLSTYSSRLENAKLFLQLADKKTLVLLDEFGSGTDPKTGGAIAEAILSDLHRKGIYGVITTHYSNLKIFAYKTKGLVNGSMYFDKDTLSPTYELQVGRPGSSYAFEIATKSGLPGRVLKYAKQRIGKNERAVDQLLVDLQREKQEIEEQLAQLQSKQSTLDHLTKTYEQMHRDMEFRRKRLKLEIKEQALTETAQQNKEMERVIREIKEEQNIERAKEVAAKVREERNELATEVTDLRENIYYQDDKKSKAADRDIREGDFVKMRTGGTTGQVESVDKNRAILTMGGMRMTVKLRDLQLANTPLEIQSSRSVRSDIDRVATFDTKLDIRGMRFEEAMQVVETFIDQAILADANKVQIVHGKGSGALRKAVHKKLREYRLDLNVYHPERQGGGEGATIVEF